MQIVFEKISNGKYPVNAIEYRHRGKPIIYVADKTNHVNYAIVDSMLDSSLLRSCPIIIRTRKKKTFSNYKDIMYINRTGKMYEDTYKHIFVSVLTENGIKGKVFEEVQALVG